MSKKHSPALPGVLHLVAEYWPYVRTGGLAEAVRGIADGQAEAGRQTLVMLPLHRAVRERFPQLAPVLDPMALPTPEGTAEVQLFEDPLVPPGRARVVFVAHDASFDRARVYGEDGDYPDNHIRFALLARTALQALPQLFDEPPVLHLHDWHTALAAVLLRTEWAGRPFHDAVPSVLTVHNAGYQGHLVPGALDSLGLDAELLDTERLGWYGLVNLLKGGIRFADMVTTVSPTHAAELRTEAGGFGLHDAFDALGERLVGILNGIDHEIWDPSLAPGIARAYSADDPLGKRCCKQAFQHAAGLTPDPDVPLVAMSARLVEQKGFDLLLGSGIIERRDAQWAFLGEGEPRYREALGALAGRYPDRVTCSFDFSEDQEHRLLAAADMLLMPSLYEPCGLTQMRAQRYGALPVVRRVGGLADTVDHGVTGFVFDDYQPQALVEAVGAALRLHRDREAWTRRVSSAMSRDFGWAQAVARYDLVYARAGERRTWPDSQPGRSCAA